MRFEWTPIALAQGSLPEALIQLFPLFVIFAIFYFLLIAPQRKRQKALQEMINNLKNGDRVITTGGLYGEVVSVKENAIQLKISDNVKVRLAKSAVAGLESSEDRGGANQAQRAQCRGNNRSPPEGEQEALRRGG